MTFQKVCQLRYLFIIIAALHSALPAANRAVDTGERSFTFSTCDSAAHWSGGVTDTVNKVEGNGAIQWRHRDHNRLTYRGSIPPFNEYRSIRFRLHCNSPSKAQIKLVFVSENPATEGPDYYITGYSLDFSGWKEILIDRTKAGSARTPLGWDKITSIYFTSTGWEMIPDTNVVATIDWWELTDDTLDGISVSDRELLGYVNLDYPGLSSVKTAVEANNLESAKRALAQYYRSRKTVSWQFDPHAIDRTISFNKSRADTTVKGYIQTIGIWHHFADGEIDWHYNPTRERTDLALNHEWQWQTNRMSFWNDLGKAWWATADSRYSITFVNHLRSWARQCARPHDSGNGPVSAWRTIECGIRFSQSWPDAFLRFLHAPEFTDEDLVLFLKIAVEHARHLSANYTSGNWLTMELNGLYTIGGLFPEFKEASSYRKKAIELMHADMNVQFLPDGAQIELTPGYHKVAIDNARAIIDKAAMFDRTGELPADFSGTFENTYAYMLSLMTPNRSLPRFNDSWDVNVRAAMKEGFALFPHRGDFQWIATDGNTGAAPAFTSRELPWAGYCVMRSGWETSANYLCFDTGPLGYSHVHQDKLSVALYSGSREMLFDDGGGPYESSIWRAYATDTYAHNTVLVDGKPQRRNTSTRWANVAGKPQDVQWQSTPIYDYAVGSYREGYGSVSDSVAIHERRVLFIKPDLYFILDMLLPRDTLHHTYQARWHLRSTVVTGREDNGIFSTVDTGTTNCAIIPLLNQGLTVKSASDQRDGELLGWFVSKSGSPEPATTVMHSIGGKGKQYLFTLLAPLKAGTAHLVQKVTRQGAFGADIELLDGRNIRISADTVATGTVRYEERSSAGELLKSFVTNTVAGIDPGAARFSANPQGVRLSFSQRSHNAFLIIHSGAFIDRDVDLRIFTINGRLVWRKRTRFDSQGTAIVPFPVPGKELYLLRAGLEHSSIVTSFWYR
jgi:hypothetical protein